jgi:pyoverdine/dityrosine biosynthesis protein Dit1
MHDLDADLTAIEVLRTVLAYQRRVPNTGCMGAICVRCMRIHLQSVKNSIEQNRRIEFILPAFPVKSPNPAKVLGVQPDTAEELALQFLNSLCEKISDIYPPGARIAICSDGRVFSDLIGVDDDAVTAYRNGIERMIHLVGSKNLTQFTLDDVYAGKSHEEMRQLLDAKYGCDLIELRKEVKSENSTLGLYRGITKFLFEDRLTPDFDGSKASLQRKCRKLAYGVISRSRSWGNLLSDLFPNAVRLSIHPQACSTNRIGILLVDTPDNWLTPWHSVAVKIRDQFTLMKRADAERAGAQLVHVAGQPSYFVLDVIPSSDGNSDVEGRRLQRA